MLRRSRACSDGQPRLGAAARHQAVEVGMAGRHIVDQETLALADGADVRRALAVGDADGQVLAVAASDPDVVSITPKGLGPGKSPNSFHRIIQPFLTSATRIRPVAPAQCVGILLSKRTPASPAPRPSTRHRSRMRST